MGLFWSVTWRVSLVIVLMVTVLAIIQAQTSFLQLIGNNDYQPTFFWSLISALLGVMTVWDKRGAVFFVFGYRLSLSDEHWFRLNYLMLTLFVGLALMGLLVVLVASDAGWATYKLWAQPAWLVLWPLLCASYAVKCFKR